MRRLALVAITLLASCSRSKPAPQPAPIAEAPGTAPITATDPIGQPGSTNLAPLAGLPHELDDESAHRPGVKVTVEKLFSALDAKGIKLATQHQVLASAAAASYCQLGVTPDTIAIAVCEYPSHDAALAGRKMMDGRFSKLVPDAVREVNGATLVTIANASQHRDVRDQILTTFKTL
jgi:hypothetical protein